MVKVDDLSKEIAKALQTYTVEVSEGMERAKIEAANEGVKELKQTSPKRTGAYARSWGRKKSNTAQVIHNRRHYQLTHLLEKGHATRNGGRTQAQVHIAPAEDKVVKSYEEKIEKVIKG